MAISFIDEWLVAEGTDSGRWYVIHTLKPRFIIEICNTDDGYESGESLVIDDCIDAQLLAKLARQAGDVFVEYDKR
jgi:hypothetical protein